MFDWFGKKKDADKPAEPQPQQPTESPAGTEEKPAPSLSSEGRLAKLKSALSLTGQGLVGKIFGVMAEGEEFTEDKIDEIEEILIRSDVGLDTAVTITDRLRERKHRFNTTDDLMGFLREEFTAILTPYEEANRLNFQPGKLNVYLVVGVNGAGKTTFIGKLAHRFQSEGKTVVIGAGDTFRAAAVEQLKVWADRAGATFVGPEKTGESDGNATDPSSVIFDAINTARQQNAEVVLLDTAGRLQNKFNLMEELRKIRRVIDKAMPPESEGGAHYESLLVLDATTGQNALKQAEVFKEAVAINGVVLTKLDGSAKGGVVLNIAREHKLPVKMVGVGEGIEDLKEFHAAEFVDALFSR